MLLNCNCRMILNSRVTHCKNNNRNLEKCVLCCFHCRKQMALSAQTCPSFAICMMGFSRLWLNIADKDIKVHTEIFPMIQRAKNDRSVQGALPALRQCVISGKQVQRYFLTISPSR